MRQPYAFSLIELLVVVAIIALLLSIILPVIGAVRGAAESAGCLSNLRQLTTAQQVYAQDHAGIEVAHRLGNGTPWTELLMPYLADGMDATDSENVRHSGIFHGCATYRRSVFYKSLVQSMGNQVLNYYGVGYGHNPKPLSPFLVTTPWGQTDSPGSDWESNTWALPPDGIGTKRNFKLARIPDPTTRCAFADCTHVAPGGSIHTNAFTLAPWGGMFGSVGPGQFIGGDPERHRGRANYAFFDGHARPLAHTQQVGPGWTICDPSRFTE